MNSPALRRYILKAADGERPPIGGPDARAPASEQVRSRKGFNVHCVAYQMSRRILHNPQAVVFRPRVLREEPIPPVLWREIAYLAPLERTVYPVQCCHSSSDPHSCADIHRKDDRAATPAPGNLIPVSGRHCAEIDPPLLVIDRRHREITGSGNDDPWRHGLVHSRLW